MIQVKHNHNIIHTINTVLLFHHKRPTSSVYVLSSSSLHYLLPIFAFLEK